MEELFNYVVERFGIKINSILTSADIEDELKDIKDFNSYRLYIRENKNHYDFNYMSGLDKFFEITKRYKKIEAENINKDLMNSSLQAGLNLVNKFKTISVLVEQDDTFELYKIPNTDGTPSKEFFFTQKERNLLSHIGTPKQCLDLKRSVSGRDMFEERVLELIKSKILGTLKTKECNLLSSDKKPLRIEAMYKKIEM